MKARFIACPDCARHVRDGDCACPFCGAKVPAARPLRTVTERLSRAAMQAVGAAGVAVVLADCSSGDVGTSVFYGIGICSSCDDASTGASGDATASDSNTGVFYGTPCFDGDCLLPDGSSDAQEASVDAGADAAEGGDAEPGDAPADVDGGS